MFGLIVGYDFRFSLLSLYCHAMVVLHKSIELLFKSCSCIASFVC